MNVRGRVEKNSFFTLKLPELKQGISPFPPPPSLSKKRHETSRFLKEVDFLNESHNYDLTE